MKHTLAIIVALTSLTTLASTEIKRLKVPAHVHQAVDENYDFGRNQADFGGISSVRYFKVIKGSQYRNLKGIISYLIENEKGNISNVCFEGTLSECIQKFKKDENADAHYMMLYTEDDSYPETINFDSHLRTIDKFIDQKVPKGHGYTACENVWSVDVCTTIIIDSEAARAVTVDFDYGA